MQSSIQQAQMRENETMVEVSSGLIRLRALVGYLGERDQREWWNTSFLSPTGQRFLERPFPRSSFSAALHSVTVAARRVHDESVGKGKVDHLFRLRPAMERQLAESLRSVDVEPIRSLIHTQDDALDGLKSMARAVSDRVGAVRVGERMDLQTPDGVGRLAGYYHAAFTSGQLVFPYFSTV